VKTASRPTILYAATIFIALSALVSADPLLDGRFDAHGGYTDDSQLWRDQDHITVPVSSSAFVFIILSGSFVARCSLLALRCPIRKLA
jgi:hypothetical protein